MTPNALITWAASVIVVSFISDAAAQNTATEPLAWGSNSAGQLGYPNPESDLSPDLVVGLGFGSGVTAISAGGAHNLALMSDGTVVAWGNNATGQLGDGTTTPRTAPVPVTGLGAGSGVVAIAAGGGHSLALKSDGTVLAWGTNNTGQLGDGTRVSRRTPTQVFGLSAGSGVIAIAAGGHSLALKADGTVMTWGANANGQLGDNTTTDRTAPVQVNGLGAGTGVVAIAGGSAHSLALKADGTVLAWGLNGTGQIGDGTTTNRLIPVGVNGLGAGSGVVFVSGGANHSVAIADDGGVLAWGLNSTGQLGDGTLDQQNSPVPVVGLSSIVAVSASSNYTVALKSDGTIAAWGGNANGQLGDGTTTNRLTPVPVTGSWTASGVTAIAAGASGFHSLALKSDGAVLAWGNNANGQLGDGSIHAKLQPFAVAGLGGIVAMAGGLQFSMALRVDGSVLAWGANANGQLGDGTTNQHTSPTPVAGLDSSSGIIAISAGSAYALALKSDGTVLAWGANGNGQLGDGTTTNRVTPVPVSGLSAGSGVVAIAAGTSHSLALKSDGSVLAWGSNTNGSLGDGTTTQRNTPVQVSSLGPGSGVVAIDAGSSHSLGLKSDGAVLAWGSNVTGQLGVGDTIQRLIPNQVNGLGFGSGIVSIAAGGGHSLALRDDGAVVAWGLNATGQLGDNTTVQRITPVAVGGLGSGSGIVAIATGGSHSLALGFDGALQAWGTNSSGQLGDGTLENRLAPVSVSGLGTGSGLKTIDGGGAHSLANPSLSPDGLLEIVKGLILESKLEGGLSGKLDEARKALARGNTRVALNKFADFVALVEAQRGKALTDADADLLIAYANALISVVQSA